MFSCVLWALDGVAQRRRLCPRKLQQCLTCADISGLLLSRNAQRCAPKQCGDETSPTACSEASERCDRVACLCSGTPLILPVFGSSSISHLALLPSTAPVVGFHQRVPSHGFPVNSVPSPPSSCCASWWFALCFCLNFVPPVME